MPGRYGPFGGRYVPESLVPACAELAGAFTSAWSDPSFRAELAWYSAVHAGRPTPLTPARTLSAHLGINLLLKREDLAHTGSHKINNVLGQALLARRMGKTRLIAETGAGQHGVATATAAALFGLRATIYMGTRDIERQELNVFRMRLLGAEVVPVTTGTRTLKDATNEAMRQWVAAVADTHFCLGSVTGPHPYPFMVRQFQSIIGTEARHQYATLPPHPLTPTFSPPTAPGPAPAPLQPSASLHTAPGPAPAPLQPSASLRTASAPAPTPISTSAPASEPVSASPPAPAPLQPTASLRTASAPAPAPAPVPAPVSASAPAPVFAPVPASMPASRSAGVDASAFAPGSTPVPSSAPAPAPVPDVVVACVGGGSNAAGTFTAFTGTTARLVGVEAAGGAAMSHGTPGVVHGTRSMVLQDEAGQIAEAHSIAAGLDYPGVGPEHAHWGTSGQATYVTVTDDEVVAALTTLARTEGIICALESAHAVAWVLRAAGTPDLPHGSTVLLTLSGRGDKDMAQLAEASLLDPPQPPTARPPTPDKPAPDAVRPPLPSSNAFSPNVTPLHEVSPDAVSLHEVSPNAVSPNAVSPNAVSPDVAAPARKARP